MTRIVSVQMFKNVQPRALQVSSVSLMGPAYSLDVAPIRPSGSRAGAAQSQSLSFGGGSGARMRANSTRSPAKERLESGKLPIDVEQMHWEVVQRILFLYALLNPGTSYVQVRRDAMRATVFLMRVFSILFVHPLSYIVLCIVCNAASLTCCRE